tara:strand:+ start:1509 stop:1640 length:132 start_codon:yes stop_codon:yes gene_type:complete
MTQISAMVALAELKFREKVWECEEIRVCEIWMPEAGRQRPEEF